MNRILPLALLLALAACATTPKAPPPPPPAPPPPGLGRIIGSTAAGVSALLGPASLDRIEGPARQLQFIRPLCVLDVFLYPGANGVAVVRTATARKPDGSRIDAGACFALLAPTPVGAPTTAPERGRI